jgi:hypothetical protein
MESEKKIEIEISPAAARRFAEAAQLLERAAVFGETPDGLIAFMVSLANPALVVRRTLALEGTGSLTLEEEYDSLVGFV